MALKMLAVGAVVDGAVVLATAPGEWTVLDEMEAVRLEMQSRPTPVYFSQEDLEALDEEHIGESEARPW